MALVEGESAPEYMCRCGRTVPVAARCADTATHDRIHAQLLQEFPKGIRIFYNYWAYPLNCPGVISGYVRRKGENWGWVRIKFDHLKGTRACPVYSTDGWHISHEPLEEAEARRLSHWIWD